MPIQRTELLPGYPIFEINHPTATARVALHGAHLMEWTPAGQKPGLYLSPQALYQPGKPIRGGIPVCWPWFGPNPDPALPMHGFARIRLWEPGPFTEDATGVHLIFTLTDDAETRRLWPHAFHLELTIHIGTSLRVALRMTNSSDTPITITSALHTYLTVGDIHQTKVSGLDQVHYLDTVSPPAEHQQSGDIIFDREIDRVYQTANVINVHDEALQRTMTITGSGSNSAVVWNPWIAKSKTLTDLPDEAYQEFLCIETTNARGDSITILPKGIHTLTTTIGIKPVL